MNIPQHIAIIMDGNGRWARSRGLPRVMGHRSGTKATRRAVDACGRLGVKYLTLYVFSSENWLRPQTEVDFLMGLLVEMLDKEVRELHKSNVKLKVLGNVAKLADKQRQKLEWAMEFTSQNTGLQLNLAISYGGRQEITDATKRMAQDLASGIIASDAISEELFAKYLYLPEVPDPELMIRTGGESRISNYLLWQMAYSEFYFTDILWPDFDEDELKKAIQFYNQRQRRFGKVLEA
jgi:undecaprenyl diphosphate synthase